MDDASISSIGIANDCVLSIRGRTAARKYSRLLVFIEAEANALCDPLKAKEECWEQKTPLHLDGPELSSEVSDVLVNEDKESTYWTVKNAWLICVLCLYVRLKE